MEAGDECLEKVVVTVGVVLGGGAGSGCAGGGTGRGRWSGGKGVVGNLRGRTM